MDLDNIIVDIINDFFNDSDAHILYLSLDSSLMGKFATYIPGNPRVSNLKDTETFRSPLAPFLQIIKSCRPTKEEIEKNVYHLHKDFFLSYITEDTVSERLDVLITEELYYEKMRCKETILALISSLITNNVVVLNSQFLCDESIDIIRQLEKTSFSGKFIFCFDLSQLNSEFSPNPFFKEIASKKNYFEITNYENSSEVLFSVESTEFEVDSFDSLHNALLLNRIFLSLDQGKKIVKYISEKLESFSFSKDELRNLFFQMALVCFYSDNTDDASFYLNNVIEGHVGDALENRSMFYFSQILFAKNSFSSAIKYANLVLQNNEDKSDSAIYALSFMMAYIINERIGRTSSIENYEKAQKLLNKVGLINNKIYTSLVMPWPYLENPSSYKKLFYYVVEAADAAKKIDNQFALSSACHWKGIVLARNGKKDEALDCYFECDRIRSEIGEVQAIIKIRNGISYEYLVRSEYQKAYDLINSFLNRIGEVKDYTEVIVTLYNLSKTLFFSRNYKEANEVFQKVLNLMRLFGMEDFIYCSYNDVILLKAIIDFYNGDYTQAKISLHNILTNGKSLTVGVSPFLDFLNAIISIHEKNLSKSLLAFEKAEETFNRYCVGQEYQLAFMYFEYSTVLNSFMHKNEANVYFEKGCKIAKAKDLSYYNNVVVKLSPSEYSNVKIPFPAINANLEYIEEFAMKEQLVNRLHKKVQDSQFLNKIMNFSTHCITRPEYASNVAQALFDYTLSDGVFIAEHNLDSWEVMASVSRSEQNIPEFFEWEQLSQKAEETQDLIICQDSLKIIYADISKFGFSGGVIIIPSKNTPLSLEDRNIIGIALSSIQAQLTMLKQNEHLMLISSTDQLSQLKNRRALQERLSIDSEMVRRYEGRRDTHLQVTITFIDLDNFKYYNDTFGHESGDLLISCFAALLKRIYRRVDFISRFGGDEFVILLPNTTPEEAGRAVDRVKEALVRSNYFIPELEQLLKETINISQNKRIGFSAGICSNFDLDDKSDMEETMNSADRALYYAKQHGKDAWYLWSSIKDKE